MLHIPLILFIITATSVFGIEACVMFILSNFTPYSVSVAVMIMDASVLTILIVPILYFSLVRPMRRNIEERLIFEEKLEQATLDLEVKVSERTSEIRITNEKLQHEIAERTETERKLFQVNTQLQHLLRSVPAVIYSCRIDGNRFLPSYASCGTNDFLKCESDEFLHDPDWWSERIHPDDREQVFSAFPDKLFEEGVLSHEYRFKSSDGTYQWINDTVKLIRDQDGKPLEIVGAWLDITERKEHEINIQHLAYHDNLTGLPNKGMLFDRFSQIVNRMIRKKQRVAILFIDLNRFKIINDTLGHSAGDEMLKEIALRLSMIIRTSDTVARLGGDEFVMLLPDIIRIEDVLKLIERVFETLEPPFKLREHELTMTTSIGVSIFPDDGEHLETLLSKADTAMYRAKKERQNSYQFYTTDMQVNHLERMKMEEKLRKAIGHNEFLLHYQPQFDIDKGEVVGIEALIRWNDPENGLIPPGNFIPLAEDTGLIIPLGKWIAGVAIKQNKLWQEKGLNPVVMAINVSKLQFKQNFVNMITQILIETGLDPTLLEIEITESVIMDDYDATQNLLKKIKELGVRIAIDDFGIGYSSLGYLRSMPVDILKIDKSFVNNVTSDEDARAICHAIISLANSLHIDVIAEGVETIEQLTLLRDLNCRKVQGYLISRPVPADDFEPFLDQNWRFKEVQL